MQVLSQGTYGIVLCIFVVRAGGEEVEQHLAMGMKLVSAGQLSDALSHYHAAVGNIPPPIKGIERDGCAIFDFFHPPKDLWSNFTTNTKFQ